MTCSRNSPTPLTNPRKSNHGQKQKQTPACAHAPAPKAQSAKETPKDNEDDEVSQWGSACSAAPTVYLLPSANSHCTCLSSALRRSLVFTQLQFAVGISSREFSGQAEFMFSPTNVRAKKDEASLEQSARKRA